MIKPSGIRDRLRSSVLNDLAKERANKRLKIDEKVEKTVDNSLANNETVDELEATRLDIDRRMAKTRDSTSGLLSILPRPKNASAFGPTVKLDQLLNKIHEQVDDHSTTSQEKAPMKVGADGMIEIDVSKEISDMAPNIIKDSTIEKSKPGTGFIPKGKEKQKNQITYLASLGKANELEQKEKASQSRANKAAARSKYGW